MQEQMRGKLLDTRAGKGHTPGCKSRGGVILLDARAVWRLTPGRKSRGQGRLLEARAGDGAYSWLQEQGRGILLDARAGEGSYSWMQEQGWGVLLDARADEGACSWMQEQLRGHNPGCKSRVRGILLDASAGVWSYTWKQEQTRGHTPGCKSRGGGILLEQEQERRHTLGRREGILLGTRDRSFRHQRQILESQIPDEDIFLIELFSCSKTLLFSLSRCIKPEHISLFLKTDILIYPYQHTVQHPTD